MSFFLESTRVRNKTAGETPAVQGSGRRGDLIPASRRNELSAMNLNVKTPISSIVSVQNYKLSQVRSCASNATPALRKCPPTFRTSPTTQPSTQEERLESRLLEVAICRQRFRQFPLLHHDE